MVNVVGSILQIGVRLGAIRIEDGATNAGAHELLLLRDCYLLLVYPCWLDRIAVNLPLCHPI